MVKNQRLAVRAEELSRWLGMTRIEGLGAVEDITGIDWQETIERRRGIVAFDNYWARSSGESNRPTGDHIDLWNGSRLTYSAGPSAVATLGRSLGIPSFFPGTQYGYSDLSNATKIKFWPVK